MRRPAKSSLTSDLLVKAEATGVSDPEKGEVLYRRGLAHKQIREYKEAAADFEAAGLALGCSTRRVISHE
jgi:hypothetical protein